MAYSDFTLSELKKRFQLATEEKTNWKFLKLNEALHIDSREYYLEQLGKIMGIMVQIISFDDG